VDGGDGFLVIACAVEVRHPHAPESERGDGQSLFSEFSLFHVIPFPLRKTSSNLHQKIRRATSDSGFGFGN
jgi:hypothetical protein